MTKQRKFDLHHGKMGAAITVKVIPQSSRNEISEILKDGTIKVLLATKADESLTNLALLKYLAEVLQVSQKDLEIVAGESGPDKLITILSLDPGMVQERIEKSLS